MLSSLAHARTHSWLCIHCKYKHDANSMLENNWLSKTYYAFTKNYVKITLKSDLGIFKALYSVHLTFPRTHTNQCCSIFKCWYQFSFVLTTLPSLFLYIFSLILHFCVSTITFVQVFLNYSNCTHLVTKFAVFVSWLCCLRPKDGV